MSVLVCNDHSRLKWYFLHVYSGMRNLSLHSESQSTISLMDLPYEKMTGSNSILNIYANLSLALFSNDAYSDVFLSNGFSGDSRCSFMAASPSSSTMMRKRE